MKIILFTHLFPTEAENYNGVCSLARAKALRKLGHEVIVIKPVSMLPPVKYFFPRLHIKNIIKYWRGIRTSRSGNMYEGFHIHKIKWVPLPHKYLWWQQIYFFHLSVRKTVKKIITQLKPEAIITVVAHPEGTYSRYLKKYCGCPVITIAEGSEILVYPGLFKGINKIIKALNKYSDMTVLVSEHMREKTAELYNYTKYRMIRNGYDNELFHFNVAKVNGKPHKIISTGSLDYYKGHDILLEAVRNIPSASLAIVGEGDLYDKYSGFIKSNGLEERVKIIKNMPQAELSSLYAEYDLFCLPSRSESFGVAGLEALACGLPVIASPEGEMKYFIKNGNNGFIVPQLNAENLKTIIIKAMSTGWDRYAIAQSALTYGWDKWGRELENLIMELKLKK